MSKTSRSIFTISFTYANENQLELILCVFRHFCEKQDLPRKTYGFYKTGSNSGTLFLSPDGDKDVADLISLGQDIASITRTPSK